MGAALSPERPSGRAAAPSTSSPKLRVLLPRDIAPDLPPWGQVLLMLNGQTMGSTWSLRFFAPTGLDPQPVHQAVQTVLDELVAQMSHWDADSLLSRFNRLPPGDCLALPSDFAQVMEVALQVARLSGGAFDPCSGALVNAWGFGPAVRPATLPRTEALASQHSWQALQLNDGVMRQAGGCQLDLGAIAKGHAVDRVSQLLHRLGLPHHLVEIGGELRGAGLKSTGMPWWVDLEPPSPDCALPACRVALHQLAVATSGDYRRYFIDAQGQRRSHTLDPRSGQPIAHGMASCSVLHESALWADAWSTALMVLGPEDGLQLAREQELAARFIWRSPEGWAEVCSPALLALAQ